MQIALRTQQIIAEESHVTNVIDPLGGSYYLESLTSEYENEIFRILDEVEASGGTIKMIEDGYFQQQIADFSYDQALRKESGDKPVIGVNKFVASDEVMDLATHGYDETTATRQIDRLQQVRRDRDREKIEALLTELEATAKDMSKNIMPVTIELVRSGASMGDIVERLKGIWGVYRETPVY